MILEGQDPTHEDTKGIPLPKLAKINQVKEKPIPEASRLDWLPAPLGSLGDRISLQAHDASLAVMFNKILRDVEILPSAVRPGLLLAHVIIHAVPFVNRIKHIFLGDHNPTRCHDSLCVLLDPSKNCAGLFSRRMNDLQAILLGELCTVGVVPPELSQPIPLVTRLHLSDLHIRLPMPDHINDVIVVLLQTNHSLHCSRNQLRNANGYFPLRKSSQIKLLAMRVNDHSSLHLRISRLFFDKRSQLIVGQVS